MKTPAVFDVPEVSMTTTLFDVLQSSEDKAPTI